MFHKLIRVHINNMIYAIIVYLMSFELFTVCCAYKFITHTNSSNSWLRSSCIQNVIFGCFECIRLKDCQATKQQHQYYVDPFPYLFSVLCLRRKHTIHWEHESKSERDWEQENIIATGIKCIGKKTFILHWSRKQKLAISLFNFWILIMLGHVKGLPLSHWIQVCM